MAVAAAIARIAADPEIRVLVLHGEWRAFCAGLDMQNFTRMAQGEPRRGGLGDRPFGIANRPQQAVWGWRRLRALLSPLCTWSRPRRRLPAYARR